MSTLNGHVRPSMRTADVLIVGGGPTGLVISYTLLKAGLDVFTVEQLHVKEQAMKGRACIMYSRTMEILDQLGLFDRIAEVGFKLQGNVTYKGGEEFQSRGWSFVQKAIEDKTYFDSSFGIRQMMLEEAFRQEINELSHNVLHTPAKLLDFTVDPAHEYPVVAKIEENGTVTDMRCKYLVGADGGRSTVRRLVEIPFPGEASPFHWVRLDAIVHTDMPAGRGPPVAVESPSHGNVLWSPVDNGRTRIGFVCPPALYGEDGEGITAEAIISEAQKAFKPFKLEFVQLDWWTVYGIGQRVAENFKKGPVIIAGDAAHTHSSGVAQGMNTGIHDASNLSWKLAGVLKGLYSDAVLDTYETERRASVQQLIQLDKDVSSLISGIIPAHFNAPPDADNNVYLDQVLTTGASFTVGLGITYAENILNRRDTQGGFAKNLHVGHPAPDVSLHRPMAQLPKRLQELTPNNGLFWILVFVGGLDPASHEPRLFPECTKNFAALRTCIDSPSSFFGALAPAFQFLTIVSGNRFLQTAETLGGQPLGRAVYDAEGKAYTRYGIDEAAGALVVLRPDGIIAFIAAMNQYHAVEEYFGAFVRPAKRQTLVQKSVDRDVTNLAMGEISLEGKEETHLVESQINM